MAEDALPPETRPPVAGYLPLSARALEGRYTATGARRAPFLAVDEEVDELLEPLPRGNSSDLRGVPGVGAVEEEAVDADEELAADPP